jgi:hypothetical protein
MAAFSASRLVWSAISLMRSSRASMSLTLRASASVRSLDVEMSDSACCRLVLVSPVWLATSSTVSAIAADARASSSVVEVACVTAALCCVVVAASSSDEADRAAAAEFTLRPAEVTWATSCSDVSSIALTDSPRFFSSCEPSGRTRTDRSPAAARRVVSVSCLIGRVVRAAMATDTISASTMPRSTPTMARFRWSLTCASTTPAFSWAETTQSTQRG